MQYDTRCVQVQSIDLQSGLIDVSPLWMVLLCASGVSPVLRRVISYICVAKIAGSQKVQSEMFPAGNAFYAARSAIALLITLAGSQFVQFENVFSHAKCVLRRAVSDLFVEKIACSQCVQFENKKEFSRGMRSALRNQRSLC